ncbi:hypothetical protein JRI60_26085 [Archangium violaceum]|uniref:hypothetical protein n=1 Tax=Archangium violaceum TaxID=83451 RepID=UPI00194DD723|nr:hypothetical protein [Archangium violaceum]QRO02239.1 hypothetical protein JRI60_26085 [Archangium violaceum]
MRSSARRPPSDAELHARLSARIEALEDRVRRLEALVRGAAASGRARASGQVRRKAAAPRVAGRARPRCPGCTLELPPGRRGEACVWCGFQFDAVRPPRKRKG